jgi:hypothetical protein
MVMKTGFAGRCASIALLALCISAAPSLSGEKGKLDDPARARAIVEVLGALLSEAFGPGQPGFPDRPYTDKEKQILAKAERRLYARFEADGGISDPKFPLLIYAKSVDGTKLIDVEIMHRDPSGKGFDRIGKIEELEIRIDATNRRMLFDARKINVKWSEGAEGWIESKIWVMPLPADLSVFEAKGPPLLKKDDLPLPPEDKQFLKEGYKK